MAQATCDLTVDGDVAVLIIESAVCFHGIMCEDYVHKQLTFFDPMPRQYYFMQAELFSVETLAFLSQTVTNFHIVVFGNW